MRCSLPPTVLGHSHFSAIRLSVSARKCRRLTEQGCWFPDVTRLSPSPKTLSVATLAGSCAALCSWAGRPSSHSSKSACKCTTGQGTTWAPHSSSQYIGCITSSCTSQPTRLCVPLCTPLHRSLFTSQLTSLRLSLFSIRSGGMILLATACAPLAAPVSSLRFFCVHTKEARPTFGCCCGRTKDLRALVPDDIEIVIRHPPQ